MTIRLEPPPRFGEMHSHHAAVRATSVENLRGGGAKISLLLEGCSVLLKDSHPGPLLGLQTCQTGYSNRHDDEQRRGICGGKVSGVHVSAMAVGHPCSTDQTGIPPRHLWECPQRRGSVRRDEPEEGR